ncbi:MAG: hypothetical protein ABSC25_23120 [Roseiarcus sp.]|jgi:hypothetical protein
MHTEVGKKDRQRELADLIREVGIAQARKVLNRVAAELTGSSDHPFARALRTMKPAERLEALRNHYRVGKAFKNDPKRCVSWADSRSWRPTPEEFTAWLDRFFGDRRDVGLTLGDMKGLDEQAYKKIFNWTDSKSGVSAAVIEGFGLPSGYTKFDPIRDSDAPKSMEEVFARSEAGEDSKALRRAFARASYHRGPTTR